MRGGEGDGNVTKIVSGWGESEEERFIYARVETSSRSYTANHECGGRVQTAI